MPTSTPQARKRLSGRQERGRILVDALWAELNALDPDPASGGRPTKAMRTISRKIVEKAKDGEMRAVELVFDRVAGKAVQALEAEVTMSHEEALRELMGEEAAS